MIYKIGNRVFIFFACDPYFQAGSTATLTHQDNESPNDWLANIDGDLGVTYETEDGDKFVEVGERFIGTPGIDFRLATLN